MTFVSFSVVARLPPFTMVRSSELTLWRSLSIFALDSERGPYEFVLPGVAVDGA